MLKVGDNTKIQVLPNNKIALLDKDYSNSNTLNCKNWGPNLLITHCLSQQDCVKDLSEMKQAVPSG